MLQEVKCHPKLREDGKATYKLGINRELEKNKAGRMDIKSPVECSAFIGREY